MRKNGFALAELLTAVALSAIVVGAITFAAQKGVIGSMTSGDRASKSAKLSNAFERIASDLQLAYKDGVNVRCIDENPDGTCNRQSLTYTIPVKDDDPIAGTQYTPQGAIKYGAYDDSGIGHKGWHYEIFVNTDHQLVKRIIRPPDPQTAPYCGDTACNGDETCGSCADCSPCCGDNSCDTVGKGEDCENCPGDCGICCGDGWCNHSETCVSCPADCGPCQPLPYCGDKSCNGNEVCGSCADCSPCCGDGQCIGETPCSCPADCGICLSCGDGSCNNGETCSSCPGDCGICSGGGGCFLAGTLITMADGSTKPIETLKKGDRVLSFVAKSKKFKPSTVKKLLIHTDQKIYLIINGYLKVTPNHPVFFKGKWKQIGTLKVGDYVLNEKNENEMIKTIEKVKGDLVTYNLSVKPHHTYIAGGIVAHNKVGDDEDNL